MFDLEQAIAEWRREMQEAGIKTPTPLDELEIHLREEIERQKKSGLNGQNALEISVQRIGHASALKREFNKVERTSMKKVGIVAMLTGAVIILRILTEHPDAAHLRKNEQVEWLIAGSAILLFGLGAGFLIKPGDARDVRRWKLVGITYSAFAVWISTLPIYLFLTAPKFSAAVGLTDRILTFAAVTVSLLSVLVWRSGRGIVPLIRDRRIRTTIGIACCLLGPCAMVVFLGFMRPQSGRFPVSVEVVLLTWAWAAMAILGGVGYGLAEAARRKTEVAGS